MTTEILIARLLIEEQLYQRACLIGDVGNQEYYTARMRRTLAQLAGDK